jgi:hypothetical protein
MTPARIFAATLPLLLVGRLSTAGQGPTPSECVPAEGASQVARVRVQGPEGAPFGAVSVVVSYPTAALVVPGTGSSIPPDTRVEGPPGAMLGVSDMDGELRIVVANPKGMEGDVRARVRSRRCKGAKPPAADALRCRVLDASDDHATPIAGVTCSATLE